MTVHPFAPMGQPRNHAEEIANARHDLRQDDAILAILNCDRDDPGLGSNAANYARMHQPPRVWPQLIVAAIAMFLAAAIALPFTAWMTAHNAERIEIERMIP